MSKFVQALRSYRNGQASRQELLSEVERQLSQQHAAADTLLALLAKEQELAALPPDLHKEITQTISNWQNDRTLLRSPPVRPVESADAPVTILLNRAGSQQAAAANDSPSVCVGSVLQGRFKLIELVGEGGMSRVYKAIDLRRAEARSSDPYIAVKILTVPFSDEFGSLAVLQREAHKLQSLDR